MTTTVQVIIRRRKVNRWPSWSVTELTDAGGYRNRFDFSRSDDARAYACRVAAQHNVKIIDKILA